MTTGQITMSTPHQRMNRGGLSAALLHNQTEERLEHYHGNKYIDKARTPDNVSIITSTLEQAQQKINEQWQDEINLHDKGKRKREQYGSFTNRFEREKRDRSTDNRTTKKQDRIYHEIVFAYGNAYDMRKLTDNPSLTEIRDHINNMEDVSAGNLEIGGPEWNNRRDACIEFGKRLPELLPDFVFVSVQVHLDEWNPHIHAVFSVRTETRNNKQEHTHNLNTAATNILERNGYDVTGKTNAKNSHYSVLLNDFLKSEMLDTYNKTNRTNKEKRERVTDSRRYLSVGVFQEIAENINKQGAAVFELLKFLNEMRENYEKMVKIAEDAAIYADEQKQQEIRAAVDSFKIDFDQIEKIENITKNAEQITDVDINALMDALDFNTNDQLTK